MSRKTEDAAASIDLSPEAIVTEEFNKLVAKSQVHPAHEAYGPLFDHQWTNKGLPPDEPTRQLHVVEMRSPFRRADIDDLPLGTAFDLARFACQTSVAQTPAFLVAFGSCFTDQYSRRYLPCLWSDSGRRGLGLIPDQGPKALWTPDYRVLCLAQ